MFHLPAVHHLCTPTSYRALTSLEAMLVSSDLTAAPSPDAFDYAMSQILLAHHQCWCCFSLAH